MSDNYDNLKLENQLCFPLYAVAKEITRRYKPLLDNLDLTYTQYLVMMVLWEKENIPVIKKLESKGYISKKRFKDDERNIIISIEEKGINLKKKAKDIPIEIGKCVNLSSEEAMTLYKTLYKILDNFK